MTYEAFYKRMKAFDSFYYCVYDSTHPREILNLDNNLEMAFYMRDGRNKKELRNNGLQFKQSQISLLKSYKLIREEKGKYYSNVLFFPEFEANILRNFADDFAVRIAAGISGDIKSLIKILGKKGMSSNTYSILFSYVLDSLVWENLASRCKLVNLKLDREHSLWKGLIWMVEPKRAETLGTTVGSSGNSSVCCTTSNACPELKQDSDFLSQMANEIRAHNKITDPKLIKKIEKCELCNGTGELTIPLIKSEKNDAVYRTAKLIAASIADYLCDNQNLFEKLPFPKGVEDWKQMVVIYHEVMWSIMNILTQAGEISKPMAFIEGGKSNIKDISYVVIR